MPRITTVDVSNHDEANEAAGYFTQHGTFESHWPPKHHVSVAAPVSEPEAEEDKGEDEEEGEDTSAGTSSSTSASRRAKSGSSARATAPSTHSPARDVESHSGKGPVTKQVRSSSASSTGTSTPGTGASQPSQLGSSDKTQGTQATDQDGDGPK